MAKVATTKATAEVAMERESNGVQTVLLEVPLGEPPNGDFQIHIDVIVEGKTAFGLRRLRDALDIQRARTKKGKRVVEVSHAAMWLFEQLTDVARK